jgi:hypothetical protein
MNLGAFTWELQSGIPLLGPLQWLPLLAAGLLLALPAGRWHGQIARLCAGVHAGLVGLLVLRFDPAMPALQFAEQQRLLGVMPYAVAADLTSIVLAAGMSLALLAYVLAVDSSRAPHRAGFLFALQAAATALVFANQLPWLVFAAAAHVGLSWLWWRRTSAAAGPRGILPRRLLPAAMGGWLVCGVALGMYRLGLDHADLQRTATEGHPAAPPAGLQATRSATSNA